MISNKSTNRRLRLYSLALLYQSRCRSIIDCGAKDIYVIKCTGCGNKYIGESSNQRARGRGHK